MFDNFQLSNVGLQSCSIFLTMSLESVNVLGDQSPNARLAQAMILQESAYEACDRFDVDESPRIFEIEFITAENKSLMSMTTRVMREDILRISIALVHKN